MKRFYKTASVRAGAGGHAILLDGKPVRTPLGKPLAVPGAALAEAIAAEWHAQAETIEPRKMPLTAMANTAIDRVAADRAGAIAQLMRYGETDTLYHWADAPADLVARQNDVWRPALDWAAAELGAALAVTTGIMPAAQPEAAMAALERRIIGFDNLSLAGLAAAVSAMGSLVLGLALAAGRLDAEQAFAAAHLEEGFQNEQWGEDYEAVARRERLRAEVEAAAHLLRLHAS